MMNQGGEAQGVDMSQGNMSLTSGHHSWSSTPGPVTVSWNSYGTANASVENGVPSSSGYDYDTQRETTVTGDGHSAASSACHASTSSNSGTTNLPQDYANYTPYSNPMGTYTYNNTEYQNYYNYQQPSSSSSSQQVVACQNSGATYQSFSSFQHTGSYVAPTSYSSTYYNAGDHQTAAAGYPNNSYVNQSNYWNNGSTGSYPQQYPNYTAPVANSTQVTSNAASSLHYQHYGQWPSYYYPPAPTVNSVPGTEQMSTTSSAPATPVQAAAGSYPYPSNQPPPPGTTTWRSESGPSVTPFLQDKNNVTTYNLNPSSGVAGPVSQSHQMNQMTSHFQNPADSSPLPSENPKYQQTNMQIEGSILQASSTNHVLDHFQAPMQTTMLDTQRVRKMQIPTNPRIAPGLAFGMSKGDKESSTPNTAVKPAYVSVQVPKPSDKLPSHDDEEAVMKGTLPASLRTYVERTFARCKDDSQRAANQKLMKELITKASADGTLFTRNWDIEPLFPLSNAIDEANQNVQNSFTASSLSKFTRSPKRRTKSRWEPVDDEKMVEKLASANYDLTKGAGKGVHNWNRSNDNSPNGLKFVSPKQQTPLSKIAQRPVKKPRYGDSTNTENGDVCDNDEQSLTKYYASAIALADSPDEKRRREHRFKRFENAQENQAETRHYKPKASGAGNTYTRRASAMLIAKSSEASCTRAVEDFDWDALTVKGTCQEVEKRYLRLTSAPDPATVRPEEILEKALHMVQASQKNYLYKCDQLKSIRQDLTVQRIQNELTVKVYETHARLALEAGDLPEYNQCQSQLQSLYAEGISGCYMEFSAYNLLCVILHSSNKRELLSAMARLSREAKEDAAVKHALAVSSAVSSGNYVQFFRLYKAAPNLNTSLMDLYVEKMRFSAIKCMCKSYRPTIPLSYIAQTLGFSREAQIADGEDEDAIKLEECEEWLKAHGAVLTVDGSGEHQVDTKVTAPSLFMPEPEDAVAHGDTSLAVDDFLTRAVS
ncbi:SAC3 family protein A isoform X2 [Asparagus officinalis]|uniref:SAC3 family protein A isoform X2 n=1 Tax=Asparagus officinalis TaxID=4686 RepID=UPI00098E4AF7|nr:SAC3 family protein A isoform X2 [Asparagus officinalis]